MNVRGPKSYKDLLLVDGVPCSTFRESARKRGLLYCNNSLIDCMLEASVIKCHTALKRLFATLLVYCNPSNPKELWEMFEDSLREDLKVSPIPNKMFDIRISSKKRGAFVDGLRSE
ncbi:hypothetical protein H5410_017056 [Solanum commersonii]|uniref:Uncharacterized protein n=1 Tax=Solanum commersonii TaxID=4109 RepID=A0A9J5ZYB0_SOLCO|nr:hypothetical protein H5410_017056 [Solanum commersonii]